MTPREHAERVLASDQIGCIWSDDVTSWKELIAKEIEAAVAEAVKPGVYLELFHGRKRVGTDEKGAAVYEELSDWGESGPVFGPFPYFHTTYVCDIKFDDDKELRIVDDLVYYAGVYYGDWSVFGSAVFLLSGELQQRHTVYVAEDAGFRGCVGTDFEPNDA